MLFLTLKRGSQKVNFVHLRALKQGNRATTTVEEKKSNVHREGQINDREIRNSLAKFRSEDVILKEA